jgi:hypothetical protein
MIDIILEFAGTRVMVRVKGNDITFGAVNANKPLMAPIEGLKLDYPGTIREFPDLETNPNWREVAIERFKTKIRSFQTEEEKLQFLVEDLKKFGYVPLYKQKQGFRVEKFK